MDIYVTDVRALDAHYEQALALLAPERREKVLARRRREDALRSLAAGLLLRRYVGSGPFSLGERGKPFLPGGISFNLSHSGALAVLATAESDVGVDVEPLSRPFGEATVRRVLLPEERQWLEARPREDFLRLWTRKEAVLKCRGCGLALRPSAFSVLASPLRFPDGTTYCLDSVTYLEHVISVALSGEEAAIRLQAVPPDGLL